MGSSEKKMQKSYFDVLGICCSSEVPLIEKILKPLDGVKDVSVIVPSRTVIVVHDTLLISHVQIVKALNQARLEANVRAYGEGNYKKKWPSPFAVACGILVLLSFLKYIYHPFKWLALGAVIVGIYPIVLKGVAAIRNFTLDVNILVIIAVAGSIVLKDYWEAGTIVFLFTIAEWLESRASHKATAVMSSLVNIVPQKAVIAESGEEVNADEVMVNTILAVKAGEVIPVDGIIVEGKCEVDERTLTGESFPVPKQMESTVWAGTINLNGYICIKTTALAEDCVVARMAKLVEEAQNNKSKTQRFIDRCAKYYTPAIVAIATCIAVVPAALRVQNQSKWYHLALVVLVSGCPCALILSTPVATFCALSKAATSGLLVKGAEYLETLAKIKIMAFDKTGTITRGEFVVTDFQSLLDGFNLETLLYWVASIESKSSHPMAAALIGFAQSHSVDPKPDKVDEFLNFPGEGIYGRIDGKDIYVGNRKIVARAGCATVPSLEGDAKEGKSIGYIFSGSSPAGIFCLSDVCRTGVKEAINDLKSMGIKTAMLTGDCQAAAKHAQDQLGGALEEVHAELLPEDKARIIKEFQKLSPTAMIGDGLNDAAALATADIGISMGISGSALAMETGQVILLSNDIRKIPKAVKLARRTRRKIIENMILSVSTKAGIIALAIAGHPLVWAAVLADVGTCLLVIFNSMLLLRGAPRHGRKSSAASHVHKQCCTPVAPHVHKHGGKHSSHSHPSCCSSTKAEKKCGIQKCTGEKTCGTQKCADTKKCGTKKCMDEKKCGTQKCADEKKCGTQKCADEKKCGTQKCADEKKCGTPKCSHNQIQQTECRDHGSQGEHKSHVSPKCSHNQVEQTEYRNHGSHGEHKTHVSHSSHAHKHCGSNTKAEKKCAMSVVMEKAQECCVHDDQHQEAKQHDHGNCKMDKHDIESHGIHKHGSHGVTKGHDSHSSHSHKHCCSGTKAEKKFAMSILEEMVEECCVHSDQLQEAKHHDHGNCDKDTHDMELHGEHKNGCGLHSSQTHDECVGGDKIHEVKHCGHDLGNNHHSSHCKNEHVITEEALGDVVTSCCNPTSLSAHAGCNSQVECEAIKASMSLENRHIGGCCESFRKECCGHDPHFGVGFKGGLSEIVIE